jgi:hypothetical protein
MAEREECTCPACGLIYQQRTSGYTDKVMHACCPRCGHYMPADQAQANEAIADGPMSRAAKPTQWETGAIVEAYHPCVTGHWAGWHGGTVVDQTDYYVRVRYLDGGPEVITYHLNVREVGAPDPVSIGRQT